MSPRSKEPPVLHLSIHVLGPRRFKEPSYYTTESIPLTPARIKLLERLGVGAAKWVKQPPQKKATWSEVEAFLSDHS